MDFFDIGTVLARTNTTNDGGDRVVFSIKWIKENGKIKYIKNAGRWVKDPLIKKDKAPTTKRKSRTNYNLTDTILVFDHDRKGDHYRTVKIPTIVEFEGYKVNH